jgi:hypothetical protein
MPDARGARVVRMMEDPELGGDTLLVGILLASRVDLGLKVKGVRELGRLAFPDSGDSFWQAKRAFKNDIRRYRPPGYVGGCGGPMVRRATCGRNPQISGYLRDWKTGDLVPHLACPRHRDWWHQVDRAHRAAKPDVVPLPVANHGGALARHMPEFDWPKFWIQLDPHWVEHPEVKPWPKPSLSLVLGNGDGGSGDRPVLAVASGEEP